MSMTLLPAVCWLSEIGFVSVRFQTCGKDLKKHSSKKALENREVTVLMCVFRMTIFTHCVYLYFPVMVMMKWIVLLSVCLHVISASFDYVYDEQAIMGKCTCTSGNAMIRFVQSLLITSPTSPNVIKAHNKLCVLLCC